MGTNYYVRTDRCEHGCEHCSESRLLHLGKSSVGWRFGFQADPQWPREQAYSLWLERAKSGVITDEHKRQVTLDELLTLIEAKKGHRSRLPYDPVQRKALGAELYDSLRASYFECDGHDFRDRDFS
jgi:hypothetical protein